MLILVCRRGIQREIYEVKSSCERQVLNTAIGQIVVHENSPSGRFERFLVLPHYESIPRDVTLAFHRADISLIRFALKGNRVRVLKPT
jgi:hypothetical protein